MKHYRNTEGYKTLLWTTTCQQNGQPRRNWKILRKVPSPKTEPGRNRKYEQAGYSNEIESVILKLTTNVQDYVASKVNYTEHLEKT